MNSFDDPQFCITSKDGYLTCLGSLSQQRVAPETTNYVALKPSSFTCVHGQWETGGCIMFHEKTAGS